MPRKSSAKFILALDQGTTSSRAIVLAEDGSVVAMAQREFPQLFPQPGWVEHDPNDIWKSQLAVARAAIRKSKLSANDITAIGITNQRETTLVWDRETGQPIHNAIVWQDRRTADVCDRLRRGKWAGYILDTTGLVIDAYFSGTKIAWILDNVPGARQLAKQGKLAFGTVDTWLLWNLTGGRSSRGAVHATDVTNASRTMLFNLQEGCWDPQLGRTLRVPASTLPEVRSSSEVYAETDRSVFGAEIPIAGIAGDQHAALFGQMCTERGMVKNTYGTGCFMLMNTGNKLYRSHNQLLSTTSWKIGKRTQYALEGSVFIAGAVVQWLRDGLQLFRKTQDIEKLASQVEDSGGVYIVPAFAGLGAPHWDSYARGSMSGITRGSTKAHIARAALESIAFQTADVLDAMAADSRVKIRSLRVDGGAAKNDLLMQFQADLLGVPVMRPKMFESTALGAGYLAGLATGVWADVKQLQEQWQVDRIFEPQMAKSQVTELRAGWSKAVERSKSWVN
ncbi:MAG: glycerol kinase GlpK [Pirellulaceae bacterium]